MIFKKYDPLKGKMFQVLDEKAKIVTPEFDPKLDDETLLKMYKQAKLGRIADIRAVQYQRQGRMLTYAPNIGQEAAQIGAAAAMEKNDWFVPGFREFNMLMYRGVTLEQAYLYWAGYERGNHFNENVRVLPIDVIIGSQINHAAGLAYASKILKKDEVVLTMIGDGGTSTGEFYEGLNFGAVFDVPMVVIIQNNQYAISTPRAKATKSATLAQKAIAFGIPGVQVDGNDILAMYAVTKEAVDYARKGNGPVLIEAVTYRLGAHTTSDDPTIYRHDDEVKAWEAKDPLIRFKQYLMDRKLLTEEADQAFEEEYNKFVQDTFKVVENTGPEELENVFKYTFAEMTPQLKEQYEYMKNFLEKGGSK